MPTSILSCRIDFRDIAGEGRWSVLVASWADSGLGPFLAALRAPDEKPSDGACPLNLILTPWFALVTADGTVVRARVPVTSCHQPQDAALKAFAALPFTVVKETRIRQVETPEAQESGCPQQWKDMVAIVAGSSGAPGSADRPVLDSPAGAKARVCLYRSDGAPPEETPAGTFESGAGLQGGALATALADLEDAPAAKACDTRSDTFAVVMLGIPDGPVLTVETEGCLRMLTESDELRQAPVSLIDALR